MIVIVDLDGTLSNFKHREYLLQQKPVDYDEFYALSEEDTPYDDVIDFVNDLKFSGYQIWIMSGRSDIVRKETETWLDFHRVHYDRLFMRSDGDHQPDYELKWRWVEKYIKGALWISFVVEDRDRMVEMWRSHNIPVIKVLNGEIIESDVEGMI